MQRGDKAPEQSMEEILASIRKIIAEEPIGSRPAPAPGNEEKRDAAPPSGPADPFSSFSAGGTTPSSAYGRAGTAGIPGKSEPRPFLPSAEQEAEAAGALPGKAPPPEVRPAPAEPRRPSWLFSKPTGIPPPPMEHPAAPARTIEPLPSAFETLRPGTQGDGGKLSFPPSPLLKAAGKGEEGFASALDRQDETAASGLRDLPSSENAEEPEVDAEHRSVPGSELSAQAGAAALAPDRSGKPGAAPAVSAPGLQRGVGGSESKPATSALASPAAPGQLAPAPEADASPAAGTAGRVAAGPEIGPLSPRRQRDAGAATDDHSLGVPTSGVQAPAGQVSPAEAQRLDEAKPRTLEDTVAELLRPMLRDWLDANMPRIVEKALKVELGASKDSKPGSK
jgi:cell pole-organizing protein PopZ